MTTYGLPGASQGYGTIGHGFSGPISVQGEVTRNLTVNPNEFKQRITNASSHPDSVYPGGGDAANLKLDKSGLLFSWRRPKFKSQRRAGQSQTEVFQSFNGVFIGDVETKEELQDKIWFTGQNKVDYDPTSDTEIPNGVSAIAAGSTTIPYNGFVSTYPGDELVWEVPPLPSDTEAYTPPRHTGQPQGKLTALIKPLDWRDLDLQIDESFYTMLLGGDNGVGDNHINDLKNLNIKRSRRKTAALTMKKHILSTGYGTIMSLVNRGIITINTPERDQRELNMKRLINSILKINGLSLGTSLQQISKVDIQNNIAGNISEVAEAIEEYIDEDMSIQETNISASPMPTGMQYIEYDTILGRNVQGPQFNKGNEFFRRGFHWAKQTEIYSGNDQFVPKEILENLLRNRENSLLWLANIIGTGSTSKSVEPVVIEDILKYVGVNYLPEDEKENYLPNLTFGDPINDRVKNKNITDLTFNLLTQMFDFEGGMAHNRHSVLRRQFAVSSSFGTPGLNQKLDVVIGTNRG